MNFRCKIGEIDIIAKDENTYVFTEVKYRSSHSHGYSGEAINKQKQQKIYKIASYFLLKNCLSMNTSCRFDAILIDENEITHIKNAFGCM